MNFDGYPSHANKITQISADLLIFDNLWVDVVIVPL